MDTPNTAESIHHAMDLLRGDIQAWDLQSLLIKPMQRVLKYPLLLDKLVANTVDSHPDYKVVHSAKDAIGKVTQDINEIKRRKDLGECDQLICSCPSDKNVCMFSGEIYCCQR